MKCLAIIAVVTIILGTGTGFGGTKSARKNSAEVSPLAWPSSTPPVIGTAKKNGRPEKSNAVSTGAEFVPSYIYHFSRPGFVYGSISIRHDEKGKGDISFKRDEADEPVADPVQLSDATMKNIDRAFAELNFLDSTENYQYEKDYSHLGNIEITLKRAGRERTAKFNWTTNKAAKDLADEYRRISNEFTWKFEVSVALENQPLQTPGLMEAMEAYVDRKEISDPPHMIPLLTQLSTDERMPLMARNRAVRIIEKIRKQSK